MKAPQPLLPPEYPPPAYPAIIPPPPKKRKICCTFVDARKAAFILSLIGIAFSFIFFFILFFEAIVFVVVCLLSAYGYYNKNAFLYIPHICYLVLNNVLLVILTACSVASIFLPEFASVYVPYLPDILKEWYRYFAFGVVIFAVSLTLFTFWLTEIYYKAFRATRELQKHQQIVASLDV
ncbi:hypothetical protein FO519_002681 [Halicephalobus sp. NKZ332]|nr:hypothetical protein FO519_002681 [Halicephalobus sp. NKZ332]